MMATPEDPSRRPAYRQGLPDHHDPTSGIFGAPQARSALTLRIVLATFGVVVFGGAALAVALAGGPTTTVVLLGAVAAVATVNVLVVVRRKRRGEPG
jgi:hypothetical protein